MKSLALFLCIWSIFASKDDTAIRTQFSNRTSFRFDRLSLLIIFNKILRISVNAPSFIRNQQLHSELNVRTIKQTV